MEVALEAGADDVKQVGDNFEVTCDPEKYAAVGEALEKAGITVTAKDGDAHPEDHRRPALDDARKVIKLLEALDDHDDVQNVSSNFNVSDEVMAEIEACQHSVMHAAAASRSRDP